MTFFSSFKNHYVYESELTWVCCFMYYLYDSTARRGKRLIKIDSGAINRKIPSTIRAQTSDAGNSSGNLPDKGCGPNGRTARAPGKSLPPAGSLSISLSLPHHDFFLHSLDSAGWISLIFILVEIIERWLAIIDEFKDSVLFLRPCLVWKNFWISLL